MRGPEGALRHQPARMALAGHGMDLGRLERLLACQGRQDRRQPPCQHRLARARGADHDHVVPAGRSNLQGPFRERLALDVGKVLGITLRCRIGRILRGGTCRLERRLAAQCPEQLPERPDTENLDPLDDSRLGRIVRRDNQPPQSRIAGAYGDREHAAHGLQRPVERQFAHKQRPLDRFGRDALHRRKDPHGDRQVEARTLLAEIRRSQAHDGLAARHPLPDVVEGGTDPLFALLHGIIGQPHQVETQAATRDIDLDGHLDGVDPDNRSGICADEHNGFFLSILAHRAPSDVPTKAAPAACSPSSSARVRTAPHHRAHAASGRTPNCPSPNPDHPGSRPG